MVSPLTLYVLPSVGALLNFLHTQHLSASRVTSYKGLLLSSSNVTIALYNTLNPATVLPLPSDKTPH